MHQLLSKTLVVLTRVAFFDFQEENVFQHFETHESTRNDFDVLSIFQRHSVRVQLDSIKITASYDGEVNDFVYANSE